MPLKGAGEEVRLRPQGQRIGELGGACGEEAWEGTSFLERNLAEERE